MATSRSNPAASKKKSSSTWRSVRMPHHGAVARTLQQRYSLRWHGLLIGSFTLLLMWATSHLQMVLGVDSLALRYLITLSVGYIGYLLVLRAWAARLVRRDAPSGDGSLDVPDISWPSGNGPSGGGQVPLPRTGGGDFGGGGASGDFDGAGPSGLSDAGLGGSESSTLGDMASGAADAIGSADEGAVVVVPVVAIFLIGAALIAGAGSLALLFVDFVRQSTVLVQGRAALAGPHPL